MKVSICLIFVSSCLVIVLLFCYSLSSLSSGSDIVEQANDMISALCSRISSTESGPSGLIYARFKGLTFSFNIFSYQFGSNSEEFLTRLPDFVNLKALIPPTKVQETPTEKYSCFELALRDYFQHKRLGDIRDSLNLDLIKPKMSFRDIQKFEASNQGNIQIHVFTAIIRDYEDNQINKDVLDHYAVSYKSKNQYTSLAHQISLFLHNEHYYCIDDLGKFLHQNHRNKYFCFNCLMSFDRLERLEKHGTFCDSKYTMIPSFPQKRLEFTNYSSLQSPVYLVYYDLETSHSHVMEYEATVGTSISLINELKPIKLGYQILFSEREIFEVHPELRSYEAIRIFTGEDCILQFFRELKKVNYEIQERIRKIEPLIMSQNDVNTFRHATRCCLCQQSYKRDLNTDGSLKHRNLRRVRHHSHLSGLLCM